jgi:hypothetical protein
VTVPSERVPRWWWAATTALAAVVVLLSIVLGNPRRDNPQLDLFDEGAHYAYVASARDHHIPAWGDKLDQRMLRLIDCVGDGARSPGDCTRHHRDPKPYPAQGYSYEAQQPPLGYLPFVATARPNASPADAVASARRGGAVWTGATALVLVWLAAVEGLSLWAVTLLLATCLLSPLHAYAAATVNNDAAGVFAGAVTLLVCSLSRRNGRPMVLIGLVVGVLTGLTKGLFVVAPCVLVLAGVIGSPPWRGERDFRGWLRRFGRQNACAVAMSVGGALSFVGWLAVQNLRARRPSKVVLDALLSFTHTDHFQFWTIVRGAQSQVSLLQPYWPDAPMHHLWNLTFFAVVIGLVFLGERLRSSAESRNLAIATLGGLLALAVVWPVISYLGGHYTGVAPARYGLPLLPFLSLAAIRALDRPGLVVLGLALPASAVLWQLAVKPF